MQVDVQMPVDMVQLQAGRAELGELLRDLGPQLLAALRFEIIRQARDDHEGLPDVPAVPGRV